MSMSLDGFIAGPNEGPGNGLGDGGHRLHEWAMTGGDVDLGALRRSASAKGKDIEEIMSTRATVPARRPFEPAEGGGGDPHDGGPILPPAAASPASPPADGRSSPTSTTSRAR